ncbi:MAG: SpoIID/LytB domain-containing protein [Thermoanaerobaculum sp.]
MRLGPALLLGLGLAAAASSSDSPGPVLKVGLAVSGAPQFPEPGRRFLVKSGAGEELLRGPLSVRSSPPELAAQVGAFASEKNARASLVRLQALGFAPELKTSEGTFRVLVPVPEALSRGELATRLQKAGFAVTWVQRRAGTVEVLGGEGGAVRGEVVAVRPLDPPPVAVGSRHYRGSFLCLARDEGPVVVNVVSLEDYLLGVVPGEMDPSNFPHLEALKAQAVAARSYALAQLGAHGAFDLCDQEHCQVYLGADAEDPLASQAVAETRGEVLVFGGKVVRAYFHSTCGGHTEAAAVVFPKEPGPYLRGVPCFGETVRLAAGAARRTLDPREGWRFLARALGGGEVGSPLAFAQALGESTGASLEGALELPDLGSLLGPGTSLMKALWQFRASPRESDPWAVALAAARLAGKVQVREGVVVPGEGEPEFRANAGGEGVAIGRTAVLWRAGGELAIGEGETLAGSRAWLWCRNDGCPAVEVEVSNAADVRSAFRGWVREWDGAALAARLSLPGVEDVAVSERTTSGRAASVRVAGPWGTKVLGGVEFRRLLGLPSTWFVVGKGQQVPARSFRFYGKGWGHGVGLCQNGAYGLALGGWNYRRILAHYYPGTNLARLDSLDWRGGP